jgi:ubiquinone/menaquinone biosynthesis C-methylase UbiE
MPMNSPFVTKSRNTDSALAQASYYTDTASTYDSVHVSSGDEHAIALSHVIHLMRIHGVQQILDIGAGTGRAVEGFLKAGFDVSGIEPVQALIDQAVLKGIPTGVIRQGHGQSLPFADHSFDAVCEFGVLHHVKDPRPVISEMLRVSRRAVFLSDTNRFGRAGLPARLAKLLFWKMKLWPFAYLLWTRGKGCDISDCDGIAYSYSVYDSLDQIQAWADHVLLIPTKVEGRRLQSWLNPLLTSSHVLLCGFREDPQDRL